MNALLNNIHALYLASKDPRVPISAKIIIVIVIAYALSPIDLIPDFIPVIGYLDDLLLLPIGIWLAIRMIPASIWEECQKQAAEEMQDLPKNRLAAIVIILFWVLSAITILLWVW